MKQEAAGADEQVSDEADKEDCVMAISAAGLDAHNGEIDEEEVRERVHDFGGVRCRVVILGWRVVSGVEGRIVGSRQTSSHQFMVDVTGSQ